MGMKGGLFWGAKVDLIGFVMAVGPARTDRRPAAGPKSKNPRFALPQKSLFLRKGVSG
jgi:hypothetical protein